MKSEIIKLRKQIYDNLKEKAYSLESHSDELDLYLKDQEKFAQKEFELINMDELKERIFNSDIVYLGDFHTFDQNIRNVLRILRFLVEKGQDCIIGLEMIHSEYQLYIDAYLENHLTDLEFLDSINYHNSWRFPWTHYKLIFEIAKEFNLKVVALNTNGNLNKRDQFAAKKLSEITQKYPKSIQVVFYGELHITRNKIPQLFLNFHPDKKQTIIHQNLDHVYWELIQQNLEQGLVKFSDDEYCLISAPPWIKYESMIYWYENLCDDPDFDIHEYIIENGKKTFSEDTNETFFNLCEEFNNNLNLKIEDSELEDFNLYDHTNLEFVEEKLENTLSPDHLKYYQYLIATNRSFVLPNSRTFYCSSYSMNRISYIAGIHLFHLILNKENLTYNILTSKNEKDLFYLNCFEAMFAYFFSKIINPHRKCDLYKDLVFKKNRSQSENIKFEINKTMEILESKDTFQLANNLSLESIYEIGTTLGHILGEYFYQKFSKSKNPLGFHHLLLQFEISENYFYQLKNDLVDDAVFKTHQKRYF